LLEFFFSWMTKLDTGVHAADVGCWASRRDCSPTCHMCSRARPIRRWRRQVDDQVVTKNYMHVLMLDISTWMLDLFIGISFLQLDWRVVIEHGRLHRPCFSRRRCMPRRDRNGHLAACSWKEKKSITTCTAEQKKRETERTRKSNQNGHVMKQ